MEEGRCPSGLTLKVGLDGHNIHPPPEVAFWLRHGKCDSHNRSAPQKSKEVESSPRSSQKRAFLKPNREELLLPIIIACHRRRCLCSHVKKAACSLEHFHVVRRFLVLVVGVALLGQSHFSLVWVLFPYPQQTGPTCRNAPTAYNISVSGEIFKYPREGLEVFIFASYWFVGRSSTFIVEIKIKHHKLNRDEHY